MKPIRKQLIILGSSGKLSQKLIENKGIMLSGMYEKIFLIDTVSPSKDSIVIQSNKFSFSCIEINSWIKEFDFTDQTDLIMTIGKDYPVMDNKSMPEKVFLDEYASFAEDFYLNSGYIYNILAKCENHGVKDCMFITFDSIYSEVAPIRRLYESGVKPLAYGMAKTQLLLMAKCVRRNFHSKNWLIYNLKLGAVSGLNLQTDFLDKYLDITASSGYTDIISLLDTIEFLLEKRPASLSGGTLDFTMRDS